jgi:hypothetical protein
LCSEIDLAIASGKAESDPCDQRRTGAAWSFAAWMRRRGGGLSAMSHFPDVDRIEAVVGIWPRLFAQPPVGTQPLAVDDATLIVLCQTPHLVQFISEQQEALVPSLNDMLERRVLIVGIRPVPATATEIYLTRELLALKFWLRDFDVGF